MQILWSFKLSCDLDLDGLAGMLHFNFYVIRAISKFCVGFSNGDDRMIHMFRRLAAFSTLFILACAISVNAAEPLTGGSSSDAAVSVSRFTLPDDAAKDAVPVGIAARLDKTALNEPKPDIRVALCGVEADAGNANLDAGLVDFNVRNSAHGNAALTEGPRDAGRNVHDYPSPVFLGVTLGYRF